MITIVVLLILVGISISALTQTGLFSRAKQAEQKSKEAEQNQTTTLGTYEKEINKYVAKELTSDKVDKVLNATENTVLKDSKGNIFTVPAGFKVTNDATTVDKGIVVEDATETATKGSQFVWVPVGTIIKADGTTVEIKLDRYTFDEDGNETKQDNKIVENFYQELENSNKGNIAAKSITDFKNSVSINGGYYIGRYEARTTIERTTTEDELTQISEKKTEYVYNFVTQLQAANLSQSMYNSNKFTSDLINSYAWDTAILFIQNCGKNEKYSRQTRVETSFLSTGTETDVQCNIFDMASNIKELTTETSIKPNYPCVFRGGNSYFNNDYTSFRYYNTGVAKGKNVGFRPIIYIE